MDSILFFIYWIPIQLILKFSYLYHHHYELNYRFDSSRDTLGIRHIRDKLENGPATVKLTFDIVKAFIGAFCRNIFTQNVFTKIPFISHTIIKYLSFSGKSFYISVGGENPVSNFEILT